METSPTEEIDVEGVIASPDAYIGSTQMKKQNLWVYENDRMVLRSISFVPGLQKIFDEILLNIFDSYMRNSSLMECVKVDIDAKESKISVYIKGGGVLMVHYGDGVYGLKGSGYGSKLTNIFSLEFITEAVEGTTKFRQVCSNNMQSKSDLEKTICEDSEKWTKVTFKPDLKMFKMKRFEEDIVALMKKRVVDMAGFLGKTTKVELNGTTIPITSFKDYADLFLESVQKQSRIYAKGSNGWEIVVCPSEKQFQQVSFVNYIATVNGGTHVNYIIDEIISPVLAMTIEKVKDFANLDKNTLKDHFWIFVNALVDDPKFDSPLNEELTTAQTCFSSYCNVSKSTLKKVQEQFEKTYSMKKTKIARRIEKLEDANYAGDPKESKKCTLILTEGDSAKALVMVGLPVNGRNYYGVFPLRGKLLNVQGVSHEKIRSNSEIYSLQQILGLEFDKEYSSVDSLRYGQLMIMADQDHDGSHIKGLLINLIYKCWPSLLRLKDPQPFLAMFVTPIVKAFHKKDEKLSITFYTIPQYEMWKNDKSINLIEWKITYYKGLGSISVQEGIEYFKNMVSHKKNFIYEDDDDGKAIDLAFCKGESDDRKEWIEKFDHGTFLDYETTKEIKVEDFFNKELILYSIASNQRSIPSMVDGLKPCQRKTLFSAIKKNLFEEEIKVIDFIGYVSFNTAYRHGEESLGGTIIKMAHDYVGSNNINFLEPLGQFGTRNLNGKDHALPKYIKTKLNDITRFIFHEDDDKILEYLNEDGKSIEPKWLIPIIPMVLVNGCDGIGTGWNTYIPNYNPWEIIDNVRRWLDGEKVQKMNPWYRGFKGSIQENDNGDGYLVKGLVKKEGSKTYRITELPLSKTSISIEKYKKRLESLCEKSDFIESFERHGKDIDFLIKLKADEDNEDAVVDKCKLIDSNMKTTNMHLFESDSKTIKKYKSSKQILKDFCKIRLHYYTKRKEYLLNNLTKLRQILDNKVRYIKWVYNGGQIRVTDLEDPNLLTELKENHFDPQVTWANDDNSKEQDYSGYEYLLSLPITSFTLKSLEKLQAEWAKTGEKIETLETKTPEELWKKDLDDLEKKLNDLYKEGAR